MAEDFEGTPGSLICNSSYELRRAERLVYKASQWIAELALLRPGFGECHLLSERCLALAADMISVRKKVESYATEEDE